MGITRRRVQGGSGGILTDNMPKCDFHRSISTVTSAECTQRLEKTPAFVNALFEMRGRRATHSTVIARSRKEPPAGDRWRL